MGSQLNASFRAPKGTYQKKNIEREVRLGCVHDGSSICNEQGGVPEWKRRTEASQLRDANIPFQLGSSVAKGGKRSEDVWQDPFYDYGNIDLLVLGRKRRLSGQRAPR